MSFIPFPRRRACLVLAATFLACASAGAQAQPNRPIRVVVPFGPGGVADLTARVVVQKMTEMTGRSIVIENKPGAGGVVAADTVAKAAPDGQTLLLMSNANAVTAGLFNNLPFDPVKSFTPVSMLGYFDMAVIASPKSRFKTLPELVAYAKANPGKVNLASINTGSTQNLAAELLKRSLDIDVQIVPFNGSAAVLSALQGEQVDAAVEILAPVLAQISGNTLRALAIMGEKRSAALPAVPTVNESGARGFNVASWNAFAAPAGTPAEVIGRLNRETNDALRAPDVQDRLAKLGVQGRGSTPQEQADLYQREIRRWSDVIQKAGIPKQ